MASESLRRHHRQTRSGAATGRARTGSKFEEPFEVLGEFQGRVVSPLGDLLQALQADRLQVARHLRLQARRRDGFLVQHLERGLQRRLGPERGPPGQHLVEDRAEAVDIDRRRDPGPLPGPGGGGRLRIACSGAM